MQAKLRRAGWRSVSALVTVLSSQTLAFAQFSTAAATVKDKDVPVFPVAPPPGPPITMDAANLPPYPATSSTVVRSRWLLWPRLAGAFRHRIEESPASTVAPSADELLRVQSGQASKVEAAAAKIKVDEAAVPARRAAIRYLASVQCHYYPEAEAALVNALRADRNESVRLDAALALAGCCCCTSKTMDALLVTVSGSERDGNPGETSDRVKGVANLALRQYATRGLHVPHPDTLPAAVQKTPGELQLTNMSVVARPLSTSSKAEVSPAGQRVAESGGAAASSTPATQPTAVSRLPEIRLRPIGVIPPALDRR